MSARVKVLIEQEGNRWFAYVSGRGARILRPVPGNTRPAHAAEWPDAASALAELPALLGCEIEVVSCRRRRNER